MPATSTAPRPARAWWKLLLLLAIVFIIAAVGSAVTTPRIPNWYAGLAKPWFNPPPWVFGPVWTVLYILMAVSAWRVWEAPVDASQRRGALMAFWVQLALNALWSPVFFGLQRPLSGLIVIGALLVALVATVWRFFRVDAVAGWMLVPYVAWIAFATVLNAGIVGLNP